QRLRLGQLVGGLGRVKLTLAQRRNGVALIQRPRLHAGRQRQWRNAFRLLVVHCPLTKTTFITKQKAAAGKEQTSQPNQSQPDKTHGVLHQGTNQSSPAFFSADSTTWWQDSESGVSGRRIPGPIRPMRYSAHLTGIGLASTNRFLCKSCSGALIASALARSPASAAAHMSAMALGATFAVTEILPLAPSRMRSIAVASSPEYSTISDPHNSRILRPRAR